MDDRFLVTFWGTRGSISTPGRSTEKYGGNTSCVSMKAGGQQFIFDAGTGIRPLGVEVAAEYTPEQGVHTLNMFLSHTHWDHIQGLPFFIPAYHPSFELKIFGKAKTDTALEDILGGQMQSAYFPVHMSAFGSTLSVNHVKEDGAMQFGDCSITCTELDHPGGSTSYKLTYNGKSVVYATDNELNNQFNADGSFKDGATLGASYKEFIKDVDLLIADGQYTDDEYDEKVGWGHTSVPILLKVAKDCGVKQVAVYHHDPMHSDNFLDELSSKYLGKYQDTDPRMDVFWAREGLTLAI